MIIEVVWTPPCPTTCGRKGMKDEDNLLCH
jgi:hypothetical protein